MLLYHLMTDEGTLPDKVIPQVPQNLMQGEDQSVPRICVGQSLDDCLTGITVTGITIPYLLAGSRSDSFPGGMTCNLSFTCTSLRTE